MRRTTKACTSAYIRAKLNPLHAASSFLATLYQILFSTKDTKDTEKRISRIGFQRFQTDFYHVQIKVHRNTVLENLRVITFSFYREDSRQHVLRFGQNT